MSESERVVGALKRHLKKQGRTYRDLARSLAVSEQTVKRLFSRGTFTLERLVKVAAFLGMSLEELAREAGEGSAHLRMLTVAQERELVVEPGLLLVAACALNGWTLEQVVSTYRFTRAECIRRLVKLDRLGLLVLLPNNRVRLAVARDFNWIPGGPIERFFRREQKDDFLGGDFTAPGEDLYFVFGMLAPPAKARLRASLARLREEFTELHRESLAAPFERRFGACLLVAQREWEPRAFAALRRQPASGSSSR